MSNEEIRLDRVTRNLAEQINGIGEDVGGLLARVDFLEKQLARLDLVEEAMRMWTARRDGTPTPYGLGDDQDAESAVVRRVVEYLSETWDRYERMGTGTVKEAYKEALADMAANIANGEWRRRPSKHPFRPDPIYGLRFCGACGRQKDEHK